MPSNQLEAILNCGCCTTDNNDCVNCVPGGLVFPEWATVSIPSLEFSAPANNIDYGLYFDDYQFLAEGSDATFFWQMSFTRCGFGLRLYYLPATEADLICLAENSHTGITALSCPPDPFSVLYEVVCASGSSAGSLDVYLTE
jgi:hypothetical protein